LQERVREKGGKTYGIYSGFHTDAWRSDFAITCDVPNALVVSTLVDIREEMTKMASGGPTEAELTAAKANLLGSYPLHLQTPSEVAYALTTAELDGLDPLPYVRDYPVLVQSVSADDVRKASAKYFQSTNVVLVLVGRGDKVAPALASAH